MKAVYGLYLLPMSSINPVKIGGKVLPKKFDFNLEALRGIAALFVVWYHAVSNNGLLDPAYRTLAYSPSGQLSVLVFFVLSGYVIGLTHVTPLTLNTTATYLRKRFIRIYPIYIICLLLSLVVAVRPYPIPTIFSHFLLVQGLFSPLITEIAPAWSLNYEVIFYLLFVPFSFFRLNGVVVALATFAIGLAGVCLYPRVNFPLLTGYSFGITFWLCGYMTARYLRTSIIGPSYAAMMSALFLMMAITGFNPLLTVISKVILHLPGLHFLFPPSVPWYQQSISFLDFAVLPYCLLILIAFANKDFAYKTVIIRVLTILPAYTFVYIYQHYRSDMNPTILPPAIFYILALVIHLFGKSFEKVSRIIIQRLAITGSISYGIYLVHFPILCLFNRIHVFQGSPFTFTVRLICFILTSVGAAYLLEKKYQPIARKILG